MPRLSPDPTLPSGDSETGPLYSVRTRRERGHRIAIHLQVVRSPRGAQSSAARRPDRRPVEWRFRHGDRTGAERHSESRTSPVADEWYEVCGATAVARNTSAGPPGAEASVTRVAKLSARMRDPPALDEERADRDQALEPILDV